jgi:thiamine-monophosphate kinase
LHISVSVLGVVDLDKVVKRSGAKTNDIVCVSGDLGAAYAGLQLLNREKAVFESNPSIQPDLTEYEYVVGRQLRPQARKELISFLGEKQVVPTAMIDISDGLAADMGHLCRASGVGAILYQDKLPIDYQTIKASELFEIPATTYALYGGEDYELLFTLAQADFLRCQGSNLFTPIGYITDQYSTPQLILSDGSMSELQPLGYNHFGGSGA